jgi:hypothetical protein
LGNRRLPNCWQWRKRFGIFMSELHHELDISLGKALHFRQFVLQLAGEPGNDAGTPDRSSLALADQAADVPI